MESIPGVRLSVSKKFYLESERYYKEKKNKEVFYLMKLSMVTIV